MTVNDTAVALMRMDDPAVRTAVGSGDLSSIDDLDLDEHEMSLVVAAASGEMTEPETFGFGSFAPPYVPLGGSVTLMHAVRYVEDGLPAGQTRQDFTAFTGKLGAQGTW